MRSRVVSETTSGIRNTENVSDIDIRLDRAQEQWKNLFSRPLSAAVSGGTNRPESQPRSLTHRNQRENQPWGDPLVEKAGHHTRVYIQNVNGLSFDRRGGQLNNVCEVIQEVQADLFCGQEHNLDVTQLSIRSTLYDTVQQHWDRAKFIAGTTPIPFATPYKPGGTFMLTIGNLSGRIVHQVQDRWGRWVIQEFSGRSGRRVAIVSAYQPVDKRGQEGGMTVASQHRSLLLHSQDTVSNPRSAFRRDLLEALRKYKNAGAEILLVGDFNEPFGSDPDGLSFIAGELSLVNLAATRHPSMIVPATYSRGTKCLDYALGSARMRDALIALGYDPFNVRLSSDHRGFFLDFDTDKLFGNPTSDLASLKRRMLKANNTAQVTTYINKMYELLTAHNAFDRGTRLTYPGNRHSSIRRTRMVYRIIECSASSTTTPEVFINASKWT
jgi:exonuclease III